MAGARGESVQAPQRLILDSGAVIALSRGIRGRGPSLPDPWSLGRLSRSRWSSSPRRSGAGRVMLRSNVC